jgi:hypothetical protein
MSLYGHSNLNEDLNGLDMDSVMEAYFYDDLSRMSDTALKNFMESERCKALQEKTAFAKPTLMRLDKDADRLRRIRLMCYTLAKSAKDPNWIKCQKYRALWKKYRAAIFKKYGNSATRLATIAQKNYIKKVQGGESAEKPAEKK